MRIAFFIGIGMSLLLAACGDSVSEKELEVKHEKDALAMQIDSLETILFGQESRIDREAAAQLLQSYIQFTDTYPADDRSADYLYKGAGIARGVGVHSRALKMYERILSDYPEYKKQAETQFLIAFTFDNDLNEKDLAREAYNKVIEKFPEHEFAAQSRERLKTLDLSDEELIELFTKKTNEAVPSDSSAVQ